MWLASERRRDVGRRAHHERLFGGRRGGLDFVGGWWEVTGRRTTTDSLSRGARGGFGFADGGGGDLASLVGRRRRSEVRPLRTISLEVFAGGLSS